MDLPQFIEKFGLPILERFGLPTVFVLLLSFGVWRSIKFIGDIIVKPAVERGLTMAEGLADHHKEFLNTTLQHQQKIDECMEAQSGALHEMKEQSVTQTQLLREVLAQKNTPNNRKR